MLRCDSGSSCAPMTSSRMPSSARPTINCSPSPCGRPPATQATRTYEDVGKSPPTRWLRRSFRRCWSAATPCSGIFSKPTRRRGNRGRLGSGRATLASLRGGLASAPSQTETRVRREGEGSTDGAIATSAGLRAIDEGSRRRRQLAVSNPSRASPTYNLAVQYYPRFAAAYFDRGIVLYSVGDFDRRHRHRPGQAPTDSKRTKMRRCRASALSCRLPHLHRTTGEPPHRGLDALTARAENASTLKLRFWFKQIR